MLANPGFLPVWIDRQSSTKTGKVSLTEKSILAPTVVPVCYRAIARMPPAKECQNDVTLTGQFSSFTAISAMPP
jgi:hypothetical protein